MTPWGNYKLTQKLGKGSFASVFKAIDERTGEIVAIKVISIERLGNDQRLHQNLMSEIDIMKNYIHPCICQLHENFSNSKHISLVIQYCAGGDLQKFIRKSTRLSEGLTRKFLVQLAAGLEFLHEKNIIHRDIKSQNILLSEASSNAQLKIADFGFAKHLEEAAMAHSVCGTPLYMAPEVFDKHQYDSKVDIWSMGCVVYEMLTGSPPFRGSNPVELFANIRDAKALNIPQDITVSEDMMNILRSTLQRDPLKRSSLSDFVSSSNHLANDPSYQVIVSSKSDNIPIDIPDTKTTTPMMDPHFTPNTTPSKSSTVLYSPPPIVNQSVGDHSSRKRIQSADSVGVGVSRRHSEGGYGGWSPPAMGAYSPAKSATTSGNTSSALAAAWAAIGLLGSVNPSSSSMKSSSPSSVGTAAAATIGGGSGSRGGNGSMNTPKRRSSVNSPYGVSPVKPSLLPTPSNTSSTSTISSSRPPVMKSSSSEDFVMIDRLPNRPWRAVESDSVPSNDELSSNQQAAYSPSQGEEIYVSPPRTYGVLNEKDTSSKNSNNCNYINDTNGHNDRNDELQHVQLTSLRNYSECICSIVCAITQVADNLVTQVCSNIHSSLMVKVEDNVFLSSPKNNSSPSSSPPLSSMIMIPDSKKAVVAAAAVANKNAVSSPEILKNAMSLYLHVLALMRDMMTQIAVSKKNMSIVGVDNSNNTHLQILNKLSEGVSMRFKTLLDRAENCSNLMSTQYNIDEKEKAIHSPGPIIYYTAMELAKEASISAMLGNLEQAYAQYDLARLLIECLLITAESAADRKVLQSFVDMFVQSLEELKKTKDQFTIIDTGSNNNKQLLSAGDTKCNDNETVPINILKKSTIHLTVTKQI